MVRDDVEVAVKSNRQRWQKENPGNRKISGVFALCGIFARALLARTSCSYFLLVLLARTLFARTLFARALFARAVFLGAA
ncbi:hypothetical protein WJ972_34765 [Achromobacter insuavis]